MTLGQCDQHCVAVMAASIELQVGTYGCSMSRHEVYKVQSPSMIVGIWNFSNNYLSGIRQSGNKRNLLSKGIRNLRMQVGIEQPKLKEDLFTDHLNDVSGMMSVMQC